MARPASRFDAAYQPVNLAPPVKARLAAVKKRLEGDKQRQVTFSEVTEYLLDHLDQCGGLMVQVTESQEAGR